MGHLKIILAEGGGREEFEQTNFRKFKRPEGCPMGVRGGGRKILKLFTDRLIIWTVKNSTANASPFSRFFVRMRGL